MSIESHITLNTGVKLPYVVQGAPNGIPVIFLHGLAATWRTFGPVLSHLPHSLRAYALTQRYHPGASLPPEPFHIDLLATDLATFMDALGLDKAIVMGHSMGSAVAQRLAIDYPHLVDGLVLVGARPETPDDPGVREIYESTISHLQDPVDPEFVRAFVDGTLAQPVPDVVYDAEMEDALAIPARVWREAFEARLELDLASELGRISAPMLLVWGDQDSHTSRHEQDALLAATPTARLVVYVGAGHSLHIEEPARLAADLTAFIEELGR